MLSLGRNLGLAALAGALWGEGLVPALPPGQAAEARKLLAGFKSNPKGPWLRIRWFCNDGSVLEPQGLPCKTRGGGFQHGEPGPAARKLAGWNLDVGTVLAGMAFDEFFDLRRDHHRLKQFVLEKYLVDVDQGWIYRRARYYRGAKQAEEEEKAGRNLLVQMLSDPAWTARHYYLANQVVQAVPHGAADATVQKVRALAASVAAADTRFQSIRNQIHSTPGGEDLGAVERYLKERDPQGKARETAEELAALLRQQRAGKMLEAQIGLYQKRLAGSALAGKLRALGAALAGKDAGAAFAAGAAASLEIHQAVTASRDGRRNLDLLDLNALLQEYAFQAEPGNQGTRRERLARLAADFQYAAGAGLLSLRQLEALRKEAGGLADQVGAEAWFQAVRYLARSSVWCRATAAREFGPVARLYQQVEPAAAGLVDHLARSSSALAMSGRLDSLVADAHQAAGIHHEVFGRGSSPGIVAWNPGVAVGRLGFLEQANGAVEPDGIYVIPETLADLKPMAGILTLDSGNALSHTQLLAANLEIPNATLPSSLLPLLRQQEGREIVFAVTPRGMVLLREESTLTPEERQFWVGPAARPRMELDTSRLRLQERRILSLQDLGVQDSGVIVGPKAANLAQLMRSFPDQVAPGLVLPFGIFYQHLERAGLRQEIYAALGQAERMRDQGAAPEAVRRFIYPRLARFRERIRSLSLLPELERDLTARLREMFGADGTYGVFVRSDTNAEDLPEFTGAGLNLTVPNRVGTLEVLQAVKDVWASPLTERAYEWRARVLKSQERVCPSVIVMRAVASDKSGVIATMNLETGAHDEITVNVSEGVSAVVDGGIAESLLLRSNGEVRLLEQARNPYQRVLAPSGGIQLRPSSGEDYVLTADEIRQVRAMVDEVHRRYPKVRNEAGQVMPWDIEFGFEKGRLRLFQIRPLVRSRQERMLESLSRLEGAAPAGKLVRMDESI